jgi:hypothetical protein
VDDDQVAVAVADALIAALAFDGADGRHGDGRQVAVGIVEVAGGMKLRNGVAASASSTSIEKSICMRPPPQPPTLASHEITAADSGSTGAAEMSWYQGASAGK